MYKQKSVLITGSKGQLGSEIAELVKNNGINYQNYNFIFTDKEELDITDFKKIKEFFSGNKIDFIINCAAYTAVDKAESDLENAKKINIFAVKNLARISKEKNIKLIHISTDYVFNGKNYIPYKEDNKTSPISIYGKTKLIGENEIIKSQIDSIIIRTSWLYSYYGQNFVKTIIRLAKERESLNVIYDQVGDPTYAKDLADVILKIITEENKIIFESQKTIIYHYSNEGVASWYDFTKAIVEFSNLQCEINPIETKDYPLPARRPYYSVLNKEKIKKELNIKIPYWRDSLRDCIERIII